MLFNSQERKISFGLLVMRIGLATVLLIRSAPKLFGGSAQWKSVGTPLSNLQFGISLEVLGLVVLLLEGLGALSLLSGYLFRTCCIALTVLFGYYCFNYYHIGYKTLMLFSLGLTTVFIGLINSGPGRYAVAVTLEKR